MTRPFQPRLSNYRDDLAKFNYWQVNNITLLATSLPMMLIAIETMNHSRHPLKLLQRVITVNLETVKIVSSLPKLDI